MRKRDVCARSIAALWVIGCGSSVAAPPRAPSMEDAGATSCAQAARNQTPLLVEWSASEKSNLEVNLAGGAIAVEYTGCEMRLLPGCQLPGSYQWRQTTTATDVLRIDNQDELQTALPLGGLQLAGELSHRGTLAVHTTVGGQMRLDTAAPVVPEAGACSRATHVLQGVAIGAFTLESGATVGGKLGAGAGGIGAEAATEGSQNVLRRAGNAGSCAFGTADAPHPECRSPLQAFLAPLPRAQLDQGPPGSVRATFVSANADVQWAVQQSEGPLCNTPCTRWVMPQQPLRLRPFSRNGKLTLANDAIDLPSLAEYPAGQPLHITAEPRSTGAFTGGIVAAGIGGGAVFIGGFLGLFGSAADHDGLATAGWITAGAGAGITTIGVISIVSSSPDADVSVQSAGGSFSRASGVGMSGHF